MNQLATLSILELLKWKGERFVAQIIEDFSCPRNVDVESFLKQSAILFSQKKSSITHLVFDETSRDCVGYFTVAHKPFSFVAANLSSSERRRAERFARLDSSLGTYTMSAFLIAQFAKNHSLPPELQANGKTLMAAVFEKLRSVQGDIGGQAAFLECEEGCPGLVQFYATCGFKPCSTRISESDGHRYLQLLTFVR